MFSSRLRPLLQVCGEVFNSWDQFKDHLVIHTGEKPNHCTLCDQWFTNSRELGVHLAQEHQDAGGTAGEGDVVGVLVDGHVALQDGVVEHVVMMEGHVELQEDAMLQGGIIVAAEAVELQNGAIEERVVLQDGVIVEEGETVLIQVDEGGAKEQVTEEMLVTV